jgi:predicted dehydrogenase
MTGSTERSRRRFLRRGAALIAGGMAAPYVIPAGVLGANDRPGANERIGIGWVGTGRRSHQMIADLKATPSLPTECRVVAVSDVWPKKCHEYLKTYEEKVLGPKGGKTGAKYGIYQDYRKMLESSDVDAVVLTTPEHSRALPCVLACQAGKDVYAEKPLCLTIREGRAMVEAVRRYERVFQTGTQQRSMFRNREACELIRNGRLGKIETVVCRNWVGSRPYSDFDLATETVPEELDWDHWCGQTEPVPFSMHVYLTYNEPGWHNIRRYSGGEMANWGSHALDMVQWALGTDQTGPVEVWPEGKGHDSKVTFRYANGVLLKLADDSAPAFGAVFYGERGKLIQHRGRFNTVPIAISKEPIREGDVRLYKSDRHFQNWIDCIKSRRKPAADEEIGHRTCSICHLSNIARQLGRRLKWDPEKEVFPGDDEANGYLDRPQRKGYELPDLV